MMSILVFGLLLASGVWNGISASPLDRILGGSNAGVAQYPHQVSLRQNGNHFCGGSVIGGAWVLCAAHCIGQDIMRATVVVGTNQLSAGGQTYFIGGGSVHEYFNPNLLVNDISVIQTTTPIASNNLVRPIALATSELPDYVPLQLSGWGYINNNQQVPNNLQHITLTKYPLNLCQQALQNIRNTNICTYSPIGQGACNGDSGGPLIYGNVQVGVVSWGIPCAKGVPDVFTNVISYRGWIQSHTGI